MTSSPKRSMQELWFLPATEVELRNFGSPIDWLPFTPDTFEEGNFTIRAAQDTSHDLEGAADVYRTGFPAIRGTEFEILFQPEGFHPILGQGAQFNKGDSFMLVVEDNRTKRIAAAAILRMLKKQRNGEFLVLAIHKHFQASGIGRQLQIACDQYFERCGIEMAYVFLATEHTATQRFSLEGGFHIIGVFPGYYRVWTGTEDQCRRANCVLAQKFYGGAENMCPRSMELVEEAQVLFNPWWEHNNSYVSPPVLQ